MQTPISPQCSPTAPASVPPFAAGTPPISAARPFTVNFDGRSLTGSIAITSAKDIDRLVKVLQAQKAAFEAMEDDDEPSGIDEGWSEDASKRPLPNG
jgi:hypothetical protein